MEHGSSTEMRIRGFERFLHLLLIQLEIVTLFLAKQVTYSWHASSQDLARLDDNACTSKLCSENCN
jgi:hypothetical protein